MTTTTSPTVPTVLGLTDAQQGVVAAQLVRPTTTAFVVGDVVEITGEVSDALLVRAIEQVLAETEALRTSFVTDGALQQVVAPGGERGRGRGAVRHVDVSGPPDAHGDDALARARRLVGVDRAVPFDLARAGLVRTAVVRVDDSTVWWSVLVHHAVLDAYGITLVVRRVADVYSALVEGRPVAPSPFGRVADVVAEEEVYRSSPAREEDRAFWHACCADVEPAGFADRPFEGDTVERVHAPGGVGLGPLRDVASREGADWTDVVAAVTALHLALVSGRRRVQLALPVMNRMGSVAAAVPTMRVNVLPLVVDVRPDDSLGDLVRQVRDAVRDLRRHGRFPAERIARDVGHSPGAELNIKLFDHVLAFGTATARLVTVAEGPVTDLSVVVRVVDDTLLLGATVPVAFGADEARERLSELVSLLDRFATSAPGTPVGALRLLDDPGARAVVARSSAPVLPAPPLPARPMRVGPLFDRAVAAAVRRGDPVGLVTGTGTDLVTATFSELDERVGHLAGRLAAEGATAETLVAVDLPRCADYVVALLALHRCGAAALLLDGAAPTARRRSLVARHGAPIVVTADPAAWTGTGARTLAPTGVAGLPLRQAVDVPGDALAYVLHTSGSTGEPKAVGITHAALAHLVAHHAEHVVPPVSDGEPHRVAQAMPLQFDGSWDTLLLLLLGHEVHLVGTEDMRDPALLADLVVDRRIHRTDLTPTVLAAVLATGLLDRPHTLHTVSVGGEACPPALWDVLRGPSLHGSGVRVLNLYGPTEHTVDAVGADARETEVPAIGRPLSGTTALVLDRHLGPVPDGVVGELYLCGPQLARGYLGRSGLTAERFVAAPHGTPGERMYRTGDLVRRDAAGLLHYVGRRDEQVKIRGFRVEPAEAEAAFLALDDVVQVSVRARRSTLGARLVAYVVPGDRVPRDGLAAELLARVGEALPEHLVPSAVVLLDALPRTTNGKLDDAALPEPDVAGTAVRPPRGPVETAVAAAAASALEVDVATLGADEDFFALGGDSIRAIHLVARLREGGLRTSVQVVFEARTVAGIASRTTARTPEPVARPRTTASLVDLSTGDLDRLDALLTHRRKARS